MLFEVLVRGRWRRKRGGVNEDEVVEQNGERSIKTKKQTESSAIRQKVEKSEY